METPPPFPEDQDAPTSSEPSPALQTSEAERSWCIGLHLSGLAGLVLAVALAHIIAPLVIWLIKRGESPIIDATGKEVLNFQISYSIYFALSAILWWVFCIGIPISAALAIAWLTFTIIAAIKTSNGEEYRYPGIIRFLK